jgi:Pilus formation protein N terminal region
VSTPQIVVSEMNKTLKIFIAVVASMTPFLAPHAQAGQRMEIEVDQSQILSLPSAPGAIIIGNPSVVDVSVEGEKVFIHGRGFGQTNLTILDAQGNQIANFDVLGKNTLSSSLSVYKGPNRYSYSCAAHCEGVIQVGDSPEYFKLVTEQAGAKFSAATGTKTTEAVSPQ